MTGVQFARCQKCQKKRKIEVNELLNVRFGYDVVTDEPWLFVEAEEHKGHELHGWCCEECAPEEVDVV